MSFHSVDALCAAKFAMREPADIECGRSWNKAAKRAPAHHQSILARRTHREKRFGITVSWNVVYHEPFAKIHARSKDSRCGDAALVRSAPKVATRVA